MDPEVPVRPDFTTEPEPENPSFTPPESAPRPGFNKLIPVLVLTAFLPVLGLAIASRQSISGLAAQIKCIRLAKVMISPGSVVTNASNPPVYLSALAYTQKNEPVHSGVTYEWGISSTNSIGNLKPDKNLAAFIPQNPGTGNIWVKAKNTCTKTPVTKSAFVTVNPAGPTPTLAPTSRPTPTLAPSPTRVPTPTIASSPTPTSSPKRVFVTSSTFDGNLGGYVGADSKCQIAANNVNLGGSWKAWISDTTAIYGIPASRFNRATVPYLLLDGTKVADNWNDLIDQTLDHQINISEKSTHIPQNLDPTIWDVWTNTSTGGSIYDTQSTYTCNNFSTNSSSYTAGGGSSTRTDWWWTNVENRRHTCDTLARLYCFEQ